MAITSRRNYYQGINAHLHSRLQNEPGGWETFHAPHLVHLGEALSAVLPENYVVIPEKSLQIRAYHPETGEPVTAPRRRTYPYFSTLVDYGSLPQRFTTYSAQDQARIRALCAVATAELTSPPIP